MLPSKTQQEKRLRTHPLLPSSGNGTIEWPEFLKIFQVLAKLERDGQTGIVEPTQAETVRCTWREA